MRDIKADMCVIGAGAAGLSVAAGAAMLGRKVVLIERGEMGGDCLNYGCVPSKALIAAADRAHAIRTASSLGVSAGDPEIDFAAVMAHMRGAVEAIAPHDSQERFEGLGVTVIRETAAFVGPRTIETDSARITARAFVIATGSRPAVPPIPGLAQTPCLTNETLFSLTALPARLAVIGAGPMGVEMAQAFRRLGADVALIEQGRLLNREDADAADVIRAQLRADGVDMREGAQVLRASPGASRGCANLTLTTGDALDDYVVLIATGRTPVLDGLGLEAAGVAIEDGRLIVDHRLRTTNRAIYAAGDVTGGLLLTHVAGYHASIIIRNALFKTPARNDEHLAPRAVYCDPPLAQVGLTEAAARERHGEGVRVARQAVAKNDRAVAEGDVRGLAKAVTDKKGRILGATVVGAGADEIIHLWALAIANKLTVRAVTSMIAPYPTRGEISKRLASAWYEPVVFGRRAKLLVKLLSIFG